MTPPKNKHAVALGRKGGKRSTPAKAAAARRNGQKGGDPWRLTDVAAIMQAVAAGEPVTSWQTARYLTATMGAPAARAWVEQKCLEPVGGDWWIAVLDQLREA